MSDIMLCIHNCLHLKYLFKLQAALCRKVNDAESKAVSTLNYASTYLIPRNRPPLIIFSLCHEYCSSIHTRLNSSVRNCVTLEMASFKHLHW